MDTNNSTSPLTHDTSAGLVAEPMTTSAFFHATLLLGTVGIAGYEVLKSILRHI